MTPDWPSVAASVTGIVGGGFMWIFLPQFDGFFVVMVSCVCLSFALRTGK